MTHWIYGKNSIMEWMEAGLYINEILLTRDSRPKSYGSLVQLAEKNRVKIRAIARTELTELLDNDRHQGVAARVSMPKYAEVEDLFKIAKKKGEAPLFALLDSVQDPHNLGAIIRSADGAGIHGIIIPKDKAVGFTPVVVKSSAGAAAHVPVAQVVNLVRTINELKEAGLWIAGTDHTGTQMYNAIDYKGPMGIVMGSEGKGLRRLVRESCDFLVSIPMQGHVNSLNVSVASALLFFEARQQRIANNK